ncbi:ECF transporter S component [Methanoregula formicica]|uniref:ABC-type cobalt transport system, permease component n=1 Tax=Methanoregula formicica (strain DSM 22288 / NBRC 105244 / SMSP) TaxID=593750 RepID=L0HEP8_METFS|nr:ECF transporter S component [Methanoregula formicica]AGB01788.1 ABC-type cobalt transport system, permease component [Methanoregula formicica SMSP]
MPVKRPYFSLHEVALLSLCATLIVVLNTAFTIPLKIPGHTGIYWVVPVIIGVGIVKKPGAGTFIGLISGILATLFGLNTLHIFNIFIYVALGGTIDLLGFLFFYRLDHPAAGFIAGACGNLAKMAVNYALQTFLGIPAAFIVIGIGTASITHFIFGGLGGIVAALVLARLIRAGVVSRDGA